MNITEVRLKDNKNSKCFQASKWIYKHKRKYKQLMFIFLSDGVPTLLRVNELPEHLFDQLFGNSISVWYSHKHGDVTHVKTCTWIAKVKGTYYVMTL